MAGGRPFWLDVAAFEEALARADAGDADDAAAALREAVELYRATCSRGATTSGCSSERERLRQRYLEALERLAELLEGLRRARAGDPVRGAAAAARSAPRGDLPSADAAARRARRPGAGAARLPRLRGDAGARAGRRAVGGDARGLRGAAAGRARAGGRRSEGRPDGSPVPRSSGGPPSGRSLTALWRASEQGRAQLVLVSGEPGIGKTRLVEELRSWCAHRGVADRGGALVPAEGALAYGPVVAWLRSEALAARRGRVDRAHLTELGAAAAGAPHGVPGLAPPGAAARERAAAAAVRRARPGDPRARRRRSCSSPTTSTGATGRRCSSSTTCCGPSRRRRCSSRRRRGARNSTASHPLNDLLAGLRSLERLTEIELPAALAAGDGCPRRAARRAAPRRAGRGSALRRDRGQPALRRRGDARRLDGRAARARGLITPKVQAVIESRLAQLSGAARDLVGVAATIGREFTRRRARGGGRQPTRKRSCAAWTSCGDAGSSASRAATPTTSATTRSARSPTSR